MGKKKLGFSLRMAVFTSLLLLAANLLLGFILVNQSKDALKHLIDNRMLDIANTAADMLDGDILRELKAEDKGTKPYQKINDALKVFQDNIDLKYIYCVRAQDDGSFTFTVDPTIDDPGEFGSPVAYTDALYMASQGSPAVDKEPYEDDWGRFYSAYSPVFDSNNDVAGIVAVDFSAEWYDTQIANQTRVILIICFMTVLFGIAFIFVATGTLRSQIRIMNHDLSGAIKDMDDLTFEIDPDIKISSDDYNRGDDVVDLGKRVRRLREGLSTYRESLNTQANSMITALSSEYRSVYYVDLDKGEGVCYQSHSRIDNGLKRGERFIYRARIEDYAAKYVNERYRQEFLDFSEPDQIRKNLLDEAIITLRYIVKQGDVESYEMLRIAGVRRPEDRDDGKVHAIGMGFADVDAETRRTLSQSRALSDALEAAEAANTAKTAFLSNMSHEIRTPLNAIIGLDRIALTDPGISNVTKEHLEKIGTSANHLLGIINDILDMSRIEAGRMVLNNEPFKLCELVKQIDVMIGGQCQEKGLYWSIDFDEELCTSYIGDEMKLTQVLINILGNSVKFTPAGGSIDFQVRIKNYFDDQTTFVFTVKDTGIGMSKDYLSRLFEPFSQEDYSTKSKYGSTGLGMPITKNIIELMNGRIDVESEKGIGTTTVVTITFENAFEQGSDDSDYNTQQKNDTKEPSIEGLRVLLAEDVPINSEIIIMMLGMKNISVEHFENGKLAVEAFASHPAGYYDAILMDMRMPVMDGLEASEAIRRMDREDAKRIPIIALTANAFDEDVKRSLQAGLNAHLSKPVEPELLYETLGKFVSATKS